MIPEKIEQLKKGDLKMKRAVLCRECPADYSCEFQNNDSVEDCDSIVDAKKKESQNNEE